MTAHVWVPFLTRLPLDLHEALTERAAAEERSMATVMRRALRDYLAVGEVS